MSNIIDAKGLSCPQPVMLTLNEIKQSATDEIIVLVDTDTAKENVSRAAKTQNWKTVKIIQEDDAYRIILRKGL